MRKFLYKKILEKFFTHNTDQYNIYNSLHNQPLWRSTKIPMNLLGVYKQIFEETCNFTDIISIADDLNYKVNMKFLLSAVGVCTRYSDQNHKLLTSKSFQLKVLEMTFWFVDYVTENINDSLKPSCTERFITCILLIRQAGHENNFELDYSTW